MLGVTVYERLRKTETSLNLKFDSVHCDDIGLYVIGKYPRLEFRNTFYGEDFNWQWHAIATLRLTLLNLINKGVIEIVRVEDNIRYLYGLFPKTKVSYVFNVIDLQLDKDWLSQLVYKTINEVNVTKYPILNQYIKAISDKIIYKHSTYRKPSRAFIIQILKKYSKSFPWIQIDSKSKFLGLLENHSLKVAEIYIPRLNMQHKSLSDLDNNLIRSNKAYEHFIKCLHYEIEKDFKSRQPRD